MKAKHNSLDIMNQFNQTLPLADESSLYAVRSKSPWGMRIV